MRDRQEVEAMRDLYIALYHQAMENEEFGSTPHILGILHGLTWVLQPDLEEAHDVSRAVNILLGYIEA